MTAARAQRLLYRFRICVMEIREKLRPRVRDRYLVVPTRNFGARNLSSSSLRYFFSSLYLPRVSLFFPQKKPTRKQTGVCERAHTHARARARARTHPGPRLCTGPVSLDECGSSHAYNRETWTEFKPIQGRWTERSGSCLSSTADFLGLIFAMIFPSLHP